MHESEEQAVARHARGLGFHNMCHGVEQLYLTANTRAGVPFVQRCAPGGKGIGGP